MLKIILSICLFSGLSAAEGTLSNNLAPKNEKFSPLKSGSGTPVDCGDCAADGWSSGDRVKYIGDGSEGSQLIQVMNGSGLGTIIGSGTNLDPPMQVSWDDMSGSAVQLSTYCGSDYETMGVSADSLYWVNCENMKAVSDGDGEFVIAGAGADFSGPPEGYKLASLYDIHSDAFLAAMDNGPGLAFQGDDMLGCCIFYTYDGYLKVDDTFVAPYVNGARACQSSYNNLVEFGGASEEGTAHSDEYFGHLNATVQAKITVVSDQDLCDGDKNTFAIFKSKSTSASGETRTKKATKKAALPEYKAKEGSNSVHA